MTGLDRVLRVLAVLGFLAALLWTRSSCSRNTGSPAAVTERAAELAAETGAIAAVVVERGRVAVASKRPDGTVKTETRYVPPEGRAEAVVGSSSDPASVRLRIKDKGFCFSPGLYGGASLGVRGVSPNYGVGAKVVYWGRFGLDVGVSGPQVAGFAALSFIPDWRLRNTSLYIGGTTREEGVGGITIRF